MAAKAKRAVKLFGTEVADSRRKELRAGALSAMLDNGALRYIKVNDIEVVRGIAFLVRDENWGTYTPKITNQKISHSKNGFRVSYEASCGEAKQSLSYRAEIAGSMKGLIEFSVIATPDTEFRTNRTGFVVLHPLKGVAGSPVEVTEVDGKRIKSKFPALVDPVQPFFNIRSLRHKVAPGLFVTCRMEGDTFEMEDHRNWTDASFKTYVRPLSLPWPYVLKKGEPFRQSVTLEFSGSLPKAHRGSTSKTVEVSVGRPSGSLPQLGVGVSSKEVEAALTHVDVLKSAGIKHLLCTIDCRQKDAGAALAEFRRLGQLTGAELRLEIIIPGTDSPVHELALLKEAMENLSVRPSAVLVSPASDLKAILPGSKGGPGPSQEEILEAARASFPGARIGGGMMTFFTELNRKRPPTDRIDFITHSTCPIVHAADDISVMETLEALPHVMASTRALGEGKTYHIGPSSIPARVNPYGAGPAPNPANGRVCLSSFDPRQRGLFGAAWTLGYLAALAAGGVDAVTAGSATGTTGMIHVSQDVPQPYYKDLKDGSVYPLYHVIAGLGPASGSRRIALRNSEEESIAALAYRTKQGTVLWLGNLTATPRKVKLIGLSGKASVAILDEKAFENAALDPGYLKEKSGARASGSIELNAYAIARVVAA